jgi:hypothetical protein
LPAPIVMLTGEWVRLIRVLPAASPLFAHDLCGRRCHRKDGNRLAPSTIAGVCFALATFASNDGTAAHPGNAKLALAAKRHRGTVIAALGHLETVGLIVATIRGSTAGVPRWKATEYHLSVPDFGVLAPVPLAAVPIPAASDSRGDWFHPHHPPAAAR